MRARKKRGMNGSYSWATNFLDSIIGEILKVQTSVQGWIFFTITSMSSPSVIVNALFAPIRVCIGNRNFVPSTGFHSANRSFIAAPSFPFQVHVTKNFMGYTHVITSVKSLYLFRSTENLPFFFARVISVPLKWGLGHTRDLVLQSRGTFYKLHVNIY